MGHVGVWGDWSHVWCGGCVGKKSGGQSGMVEDTFEKEWCGYRGEVRCR